MARRRTRPEEHELAAFEKQREHPRTPPMSITTATRSDPPSPGDRHRFENDYDKLFGGARRNRK